MEQRLLARGGDIFHVALMTRRNKGMKTEPAFAEVLGLDSDPYQAMLRLECCSDLSLTALLGDQDFS